MILLDYISCEVRGHMERYQNRNGDSNVYAYQLGSDFIIVQFAPSKYSNISFYKWTDQRAGAAVVERMKQLAQHGSGLNSYINSPEVKKAYTSKGSSLNEL